VVARRLIPVLLIALAGAAPAAATPRLQTQRQRAQVVYAQVSAINARLDGVVQAWDGARVQLASVETALRANKARLRVARSNLGAAQTRIEQRLLQLYVSPDPDSVAVLAGATSISDLIDRLEAVHVLTAQDSSIGQQAQRFQLQVSRREILLRRERRQRAQTLTRLAARRGTIARDLANEQRLLATIHQSIQTLEAQQAARTRRLAALAQARVARQVALARREAAAAALTPAPSPFQADPADPPTQPAIPPAAAAPAGAPAPAVPPLVPSPAPTTHAEAASIAARYLGVPYVWGGESPADFDCSGLVSYVYAQLGVSLPHYTVSQWDATIPIATTDLQPGDLVFFDGLGHVGIYIGGGQFIHAPHTGTVVQIASLSGYWTAHLDGARRVP
jgi:peptidoglycan DL-endopeptidase CwlO